MKTLILINILFALGLVSFLVLPVTDNWLWLIFISSWFVAEAWLSKDQSILWWQWALLFICLGALDVGLVYIISFYPQLLSDLIKL